MHKLPDGKIVDGSEWVEIDGLQYQLNALTRDELTTLGVEPHDPAPLPPYDPTYYTMINDELHPLPLDQVKTNLHLKVANEAWSIQLGGVMIDDHALPGDDHNTLVLTMAYVLAKADAAFSIPDFRFVDGTYAPLSNAQIIQAYEYQTKRVLLDLNSQHKAIDDDIEALTSFDEALAFTWSWGALKS